MIDNGIDSPDQLRFHSHVEQNNSDDIFDLMEIHSRSNTVSQPNPTVIPRLVVISPSTDLIRQDSYLEQMCWKKLRSVVNTYNKPSENKPISSPLRKQPLSPTTMMVTSETLLLSSFGWLIIDEIYYAASLGGLKVDGCMGKVQGSMTLSQRLRALQSTTNKQNAKK